MIAWLQPWEEAARDLLKNAAPAANISPSEREAAVTWALEALQRDEGWMRPVQAWRIGEIERAQNRLRKLTKHAKIAISPQGTDLLGLYVLVPAEGGR